MSKICVISDSHFGWKGDSILFQNYFKRFYDNVFFPELKKRKIKTIIHGGDLMERRKFVNYEILNRTRKDFLERVEADGYEFHIMAGNHDCYFKASNEVNCLTELLRGYDNFHIYEEPTEVSIEGLKMLFVPWLNETNMQSGLEMIATSKSKVLIGHLEIAGFHMDRTQISEHGLDRNIFKKFKKVFSGHFHHASEDGCIRYLGAPYEYTFVDENDPKGFYIFDTETLELEFIQNPERMFYKIIYDDQDPEHPCFSVDPTEFKGKYVRVIVNHKSQPLLYEQWYDKISDANPAELNVSEKFVIQVAAEAEEQFFDFSVSEDGQVTASDTLTMLNTYVEHIEMELDKDRMKREMRALYDAAVVARVA